MIGKMASITTLSDAGLARKTVLLALAGTALTFGIWWCYFVVPVGEILRARPRRSFTFGYGHMPIFASIVATGAGMHVAAYYVDGHSQLDRLGTVLAVAIPVALFAAFFHAGHVTLTRRFDPLHLVLLTVTAMTTTASVAMAGADIDLVWCLLVLSLAPWVNVVGYETGATRATSRFSRTSLMVSHGIYRPPNARSDGRSAASYALNRGWREHCSPTNGNARRVSR